MLSLYNIFLKVEYPSFFQISCVCRSQLKKYMRNKFWFHKTYWLYLCLLGLCRDEPLTDSGKKLQLMKMLCLTVLPVLGVWSYSVYMLSDTITIRSENEMASIDWFGTLMNNLYRVFHNICPHCNPK